MKTEKVLEIVKKQGVILKPIDNLSEVVLTVEVVLSTEEDTHDADYVTEQFNFKFEELSKAIKIKKLINNLPEFYEDDIDVWEEDKEFGFELGDFIPSGEYDLFHFIKRADLKIIINGQSYEIV